MYEVNAQVEFSAAHHLLAYEGGKCEQQHGHNWTVEAVVRGDILDKSNILVDFKALKRDLRIILGDLDHQDLNELPEDAFFLITNVSTLRFGEKTKYTDKSGKERTFHNFIVAY